MNKSKVIYLDMDGTIADLYNSENWLEKIQAHAPVFEAIAPMAWWNEAKALLELLKGYGWSVGVITWTPMNTTPEYEADARHEKNMWLGEHAEGLADFVAFQRYGTPKSASVVHYSGAHILFDDNAEVRAEWKETLFADAFDACNMVDVLRMLLRLERM